ncbi:hypothetical protein AK812_SmicGene33717 [Symbiodinium microadriaticum]|uniref:Uncharacterized protein n=1 Tax=Symbiodinium microadriaticum TaxID=2951 RepID=A0A1Q9CQX7_SYMMI|nr:hypothetical protein AK812_SmicGene33717 [Symbiodinium microadriaticum]
MSYCMLPVAFASPAFGCLSAAAWLDRVSCPFRGLPGKGRRRWLHLKPRRFLNLRSVPLKSIMGEAAILSEKLKRYGAVGAGLIPDSMATLRLVEAAKNAPSQGYAEEPPATSSSASTGSRKIWKKPSGGVQTRQDILELLDETIRVQGIVQTEISQLARSIAKEAKEKQEGKKKKKKALSITEAFRRIKEMQLPIDPLEELNLSEQAFQKLLTEYEQDQEVSAKAQLLLHPEPKGDVAKARSIGIEKIVEIHQFMVVEMQKVLTEFLALEQETRRSFSNKACETTAELLVSVAVEQQLGVHCEDVEQAVMQHEEVLANHPEFERCTEQLANMMQHLTGAAQPRANKADFLEVLRNMADHSQKAKDFAKKVYEEYRAKTCPVADAYRRFEDFAAEAPAAKEGLEVPRSFASKQLPIRFEFGKFRAGAICGAGSGQVPKWVLKVVARWCSRGCASTRRERAGILPVQSINDDTKRNMESCGPAGVLVRNGNFEAARRHGGGNMGAFAALVAPSWPSVASPLLMRALAELEAPLWPSAASPMAKVKIRWRSLQAAPVFGKWGLGRPAFHVQWLPHGPYRYQWHEVLAWLWSGTFNLLLALVLRDGGAWEPGLTLPSRPNTRRKCAEDADKGAGGFQQLGEAADYMGYGVLEASGGVGEARGCGESLDGQPRREGGMCTEIQRESFVRVGSELAHVRGTVFAPRGGGGNRNEDFLKALAHLVQQFAPDGGQEAPASKAKGKGKAQPHAAKAAGKGKPGAQPGVPSKGGGGKAGAMPKGKGDRQAEPARASEDDQLLAAVVRVVNRPSKQSFYDSFPAKAQLSQRTGKGQGQGQDTTGWLVDRSAEAITAGEAKSRLLDQVPLKSGTIVVREQGQAAELQNLARLHEVQGKVAIVCQQPMGTDDQTLDLTCVKGNRCEAFHGK